MKQFFKNRFRDSVFNAANRGSYPKADPVGAIQGLGKNINEHVRKNYDPRDPFFVKDTEQGHNINNLWTGYKLGGKGNLLMTGSLLGGGTIIAANPREYQSHYNNFNQARAESQELDVESLQSTRADQVGYQAQIGSKSSPMLTTSGDLVFAMHKTRHSGQF